MSLLLALDTSTPAAVLTLATPDGVLAAATDPAARHGRALLPALRDLLARAGRPASALDGIAVGLGPGSYTGLRVGVMAAKTLAFAADAGLTGFDSLDLIARNAPPDAARVAAVADAQRGDLYVAEFARPADGGPLARLGPTRVVPIARWAAETPPDTIALGPAVLVPRIASALPATLRLPDDPAAHRPDPDRLAELAAESWASGRREDLWFVEPVYLRRSAAEEQWEALGR